MIPKFRAWDERAGLTEVISIDLLEKKIKVSHWEYGVSNYFPLDDVELMQSTGLKDKNGVEIFEGDVVQWGDTPHWEEEPIRVAVVKINPDIQFDSNVGIFQYGKFAYQDTERFLTILGNIYENPELLEVEG
ncbi:YopX family protein [Enterococcus gilvus]|uniref:YopX family protein n=1 Tax=Enterococcus gilvus TaxID=160453 RepID=UPI002910FA02|nr:YopX family protein [Enterococcus gilvus]MDU5509558.1 YopX family protein [Enterococcus gilvus]